MWKTAGALIATLFIISGALADEKATSKSFAAALVIAQQQVPEAQLIRSRVESKNGATIFGFYFFLRGKVIEVEINTAGKVVKNSNEDGDPVSQDIASLIDKQKKSKSKLPDGRLLEIAGDALKNTGISDIQYEKQGDKLVIRVGNLVLDAQTGRVISGQ